MKKWAVIPSKQQAEEINSGLTEFGKNTGRLSSGSREYGFIKHPSREEYYTKLLSGFEEYFINAGLDASLEWIDALPADFNNPINPVQNA